MSMSVDGVWAAGVWAETVWADGVWREGAYVEVIPLAGIKNVVAANEIRTVLRPTDKTS